LRIFTIMPSLSPFALALAAVLTLFGCEDMERGPSSPEPPKTTASAIAPHDAVNRASAMSLPH